MKMTLKRIAAAAASAVILCAPVGTGEIAVRAADTVSCDTDRELYVNISTAEELMNIGSDGRTYCLTKDIDLSGVKWKPIRNFTGTLDANGFEIKNLTSDTYGLFASVGSGAVIRNIKLTDVNIKSKYKTVGAVVSVINAGAENVTVEDCFVSGTVASCRTKYHLDTVSTVGAVVGRNNSKSAVIRGCFSDAGVFSERCAGGIIGVNRGTVTGCGFAGTIENSHNVDELAMDENGSMEDDYAYLYTCGGICGMNYGTVENCLAKYTDRSCASFNGGIVGAALSGSVTDRCVNLTPICLNDDTKCGFIAGRALSKASVTNCFTIEPGIDTTLDDIGFGKPKNADITRFSDDLTDERTAEKLGDDWEIYGGSPMLTALKKYF